MTRFDIHVNLGAFPGSRKGKAQRYISPQEMDKYFREHKITHALVLYNRDEYDLLRELGEISETKVYGVQCIMGKDENSPTNMKDLPKWDIDIEGRSFKSGGYCYGIKMASNRGWWTDGEKVWSGLDYLTQDIKDLLTKLPEDSIVSMHTQGTTKADSKDSPRTVAFLAGKNRHLKFIMNHIGDYGPSLRVARPGREPNFFKYDGEALLRFVFHRATVIQGLEFCQNGFNMFGDMSCYTYSKGYAIKDGKYNMWTVGSDFPFIEKQCSYTQERTNFSKWIEDVDDNMNDEKAVRFFESTIDELIQWSHERYDSMRMGANEYKKQLREKV